MLRCTRITHTKKQAGKQVALLASSDKYKGMHRLRNLCMIESLTELIYNFPRFAVSLGVFYSLSDALQVQPAATLRTGHQRGHQSSRMTES